MLNRSCRLGVRGEEWLEVPQAQAGSNFETVDIDGDRAVGDIIRPETHLAESPFVVEEDT